MGGELGRPLTIRQGVGSEILVRPDPGRDVEIGGRVELVERRPVRVVRGVARRRRDADATWDAIVVGLGAIGSGAAYWLSERLGDRVLGLEQFELGHANGASARTTAGSSGSPTTGPTTSGSPGGPTRPGPRSRPRAGGDRIVTLTGGLDIGPREARNPARRLHARR